MRIRGQEVGERGDERGLAATAFADNADHLARLRLNVDMAQRVDLPLRRQVPDTQIARGQRSGHDGRPALRRGSR